MFTTRPEIAGTFGVVATTHWIATSVGMAVLERGGNAFDAAVAVGFALHMAEPHLNGPGGDVPILIHDATANKQHVICGQGVSPDTATPEKFAELGLDFVPGTGLLPAMVPGAFDAFALLLRDWGTWELPDALSFAIGYARNGTHMVPNVCATIASVQTVFETAWPTSLPVFMPDGKVPAPGTLLKRPGYADTLERICREAVGKTREARIDAARNAWYRGFVADAIGEFCAGNEVLDFSERRHSGLLTADDMDRWAATIEDPLGYEYHGHTVLKCGPWSQGPVFLQQLALLKGFDIATMDPMGADFVHIVTECAKLAFADREAYYGDPDFAEIPLSQLLSDSYNNARRGLVADTASLELRPGQIDGFVANVDHNAADRGALAGRAGTAEPTTAKHAPLNTSPVKGDTCHMDIIDRWGNMVSATPSGGWLQSSPIIPKLGFCLGTRGQMFWTRKGHPNSIAPRKRPRTTLTPSLALRDGKAWMAFGTPGGEQQDQWQVTMFLRMVHHKMKIQESIDTPNFHSEHWPSSFWPRTAKPGKLVLEGGYPRAVFEDLLRRGHKAEMNDPWSEGRLTGARLEPDGQMFAGANPRGMQGYAVGR